MFGEPVMRALRAHACGPQVCATRLGAIVALAVAILVATAPIGLASEKAALWRALASKGHVAVMRHAIAPGAGDPSGFMIADCSTQRNLSEAGRKQARRIGTRFRENGIEPAYVFSSQWCRSLETARLLGLGPVTELPVLNSFFQRSERRKGQTQKLVQWLASQNLDGSLVLVTHQVNITALTGVYPASGEIVVIRQPETGKISVVGSIGPD